MPEPIQPIVLVGGRSRRFGRDKLREPVDAAGAWLVDRPIAALRAAFGPIVAAVGECDPDIARRADRVIPDRYPGSGPIGGILSALEATGGAVFALAGDLPLIDAATVRSMLAWADQSAAAAAVLGHSAAIEPCIGLYRPAAAALLAARLTAGLGSLHDAIPADRLILVPIDPRLAVNANTAADLRSVRTSPHS